jgi:hypothetical protein
MQPETHNPINSHAPAEGTPFPEPLATAGLLPIHPIIERGQAAFRRELPALLTKHYRKWVAYHGDRVLGFGRSKTKLIQQCLRQGIPDEELLVRSIEPEIADDLEVERRDSSNL